MTPDMILDIWLGACGCAYGSQMCSGTIPALVPNPIKKQINRKFLVPGGIWPQACERRAKSKECAYPCMIMTAVIIKAVPICVMTRYMIPALTERASSESNITKKYETSDIISH